MTDAEYTYSGTSVLKNLQGIRDPGELQRFERGVTAIRIQQLRENPVRGDYDLSHLQAIHKQVFQDVYAWAGEVRTVDIAKGPTGNRTLFTFQEDIPGKAAEIAGAISQADRLRGLDKEAFTEKLAEVHAGLNDLHPFREGNGRVTREFIAQLAKEGGYQLDYSKVGRQQWKDASIQSSRGNLGPTKEVFRELVVVERAVAFDRLSWSAALAKHPELDAAYRNLSEARREGRDVVAAHAEISRQLHAGRLVAGGVGREESQRVIEHAAAYRGLMVRDAANLGGQYRGEVIGVSSHHALVKVGELVAVRYERENLDRAVHTGERVAIQYDQARSRVYEAGKEPQDRDRGRDMSLGYERERRLGDL